MVVLDDHAREAVDRAQRRAEVVRDGVRKRAHLVVRILQLGVAALRLLLGAAGAEDLVGQSREHGQQQQQAGHATDRLDHQAAAAGVLEVPATLEEKLFLGVRHGPDIGLDVHHELQKP